MSLGHELRHHYGLACLGCHFAESCLHELRGIRATDDSKRVEQQLQWSALRVPRHLVVRDDLCDCAFGALEAGVA